MPSLTELVRQLGEQRDRLLMMDALAAEEPIVENDAMPLPDIDEGFERERRQAEDVVDSIDRALREEDWRPPAKLPWIGSSNSDYAYGQIPRRAPMRHIVRGFLQPIRYLPLIQYVPENVAQYLRIMLPDSDDGLEREQHGGVKWHFHYIDSRHRRSDVILSFDTRWVMADAAKGLERLRPLFVEKHAERKAKFPAQPARWKTEKRISMYEICSRDLHKGIEHFRCAKNGSEAVWPLDATLTPRPVNLQTSKPATRRGKGKR